MFRNKLKVGDQICYYGTWYTVFHIDVEEQSIYMAMHMGVRRLAFTDYLEFPKTFKKKAVEGYKCVNILKAMKERWTNVDH